MRAVGRGRCTRLPSDCAVAAYFGRFARFLRAAYTYSGVMHNGRAVTTFGCTLNGTWKPEVPGERADTADQRRWNQIRGALGGGARPRPGRRLDGDGHGRRLVERQLL